MSKRSGVVPVEYTIAIPVILVTGAAVIASLLGHRDTISGQTYCMTQLNALNKSTLVYCEMSRGFLMPYTHAPVAGTELTEAAPSADHTAVCFAASPVNPATRLLTDCRNTGHVYVAGILGPAEFFYCAQQKHTPYVLNDYPKPWGSAVPKGQQFIFGGYMLNPWVKAASAEGKQFVYENGLSLEKHPLERPLVGDLMLGSTTIAHRTRHPGVEHGLCRRARGTVSDRGRRRAVQRSGRDGLELLGPLGRRHGQRTRAGARDCPLRAYQGPGIKALSSAG